MVAMMMMVGCFIVVLIVWVLSYAGAALCAMLSKWKCVSVDPVRHMPLDPSMRLCHHYPVHL